MSDAGPAAAGDADERLGDAIRVADILAVDRVGLGGAHVLARAGPVRDAWLSALRERIPVPTPFAKIPANVTPDRLLGGLDLAATLRGGSPVLEQGLLAALDGGIAVLPMAERIGPATAAHIAEALDHGEVAVERDGFAARLSARVGVVALDEGIDPDEALPNALATRLAFLLDIDPIAIRALSLPPADLPRIEAAQRILPTVHVADGWIEALTTAAAELGIASIRAPVFAVRTCRVLAALDGRDHVIEADVALAARLVLAPRATTFPQPVLEEDPPAAQDQDGAAPPDTPDQTSDTPPEQAPDESATTRDPTDAAAGERVVDAILAALPPGMLDRIATRAGGAATTPSAGRGAAYASRLRGRPTSVRSGRPGNGARLSVIDTLKAAAPWQAARRAAAPPLTSKVRRFEVRPDDFRIRRFKDRRESVTIFVVDASGSMANARLAEAKGAIELMLGESYVRRASVALVAFRGSDAELLLPPTRSLTRARRLLQVLPGGGGTPLAAALESARRLCEETFRKGRTPSVVILSDGRANVAQDGTSGRAAAREDALGSARRLRSMAVGVAFIDTGRRSGAEAQAIAEAAGSSYLWLPHVEARAILTAARF